MWKNRVFLLGAAALALLAIVFTLCRKTVTPLPQPAPTSTPAPGPLTGETICVDPGHGGYDGGARGQASGAGAQVILTRDTDTALAEEGAQRKRRDLQYRVDAAREARLFLSIHMNEYRTRAESGPQVFYRAGQEDSRLLAGALQAQLIAGLRPARERSAHTGEYYLLEHLDIPAVLVECGFLSNAAEEAKLLDAGYQQQVAQAICAGVCDFIQLSGK